MGFDFRRALAAVKAPALQGEMNALSTVWGESLDCHHVLEEQPHPQCARDSFWVMNGEWDYAIVDAPDAAAIWPVAKAPEEFEGIIVVPFSPESALSGVGKTLQPTQLLWYRRTFNGNDIPRDDRYLLHFEAVDYACAVYVNGVKAGQHVGGYEPFSFDITDALVEGDNEVAVCVFDPSNKGSQLRGKQHLERGGIWYTPQSGIWQAVWIEAVPELHVRALEVTADLDAELLTLLISVNETGGKIAAHVIDAAGRSVAFQSVNVTPDRLDTVELRLHVPSPHPWTPDDPYLYSIELSYDADDVNSYCAFRTTTIEPDEKGVQRFCLNHEPLFLRGVLDQGYWPDGLMTAPSDEALRFDIEAMASLGFNMIRKHIKVESERWYYLCDRMGMLVWQDMVSGGEDPHVWIASRIPTTFKWFWSHYRDDTEKHQRHLSSDNALYRNEWQALAGSTVRRLKSHPCIITWSLFNEGWGQFDAAKATESVKSIDTTRPVDSTSGWFDQGCSDYNSVHNYFRDNEVFDDPFSLGRPLVVTEFGGLSFHIPEHSSWNTSFGYASFDAIEQWRKAVWGLLDQMDSLERKGLSGYVYTQLCDVEQETNGILTYDRRVNKLETVRLEDLHTDDEADEARAVEEEDDDGVSDGETSESTEQTPIEELELGRADEKSDGSPAQTEDGPAENGAVSLETSVEDTTNVNNSTDELESSTSDQDQDADDKTSDDDEPKADGAETSEDTEQAVESDACEDPEAAGDQEALPSNEEADSSGNKARS